MSKDMPTVRVGLLWHSLNSDNMGVGALTLSNIAIVEQAAARAGVRAEFLVIGWTDPRPHYVTRDDVRVKNLRMKDFIKPVGGLYSAVRSCDLVLDIGAGDSFADIYGARRIGTLLASKLLVVLARRPLVLCPQTIGPFESAFWRWSALRVMRLARAVCTRDDLSTQFLRAMGYRGRIVEASDVALRLTCDAPSPRAPQNGDKTRIGINVSGLLFNGGYTKDNMFGLQADYPQVIRTLLAEWTADPGVEVHLVGHVISDPFEVEDDYRVAARLAQEFPGTILAPKFDTPSQAKTYIADMDFFTGARMHACIAAFSSGVPVLPMAYSRKFAGLFGTLGYDEVADCRAEDTAAILAKVRAAYANRADLKRRMDSAFATGLQRLDSYEGLVADLLAEVAA